MYLSIFVKFREAEFSDFFIGDMITGKGCQSLKERVVYFLLSNDKLFGPYKSYYDGRNADAFMEMYLNITDKKILVIEPRAVAQEIFTKKIYLRIAKLDDIERNTIFYQYLNKKIEGPFRLEYDITSFDTVLQNRIKSKEIFVIHEHQNFD